MGTDGTDYKAVSDSGYDTFLAILNYLARRFYYNFLCLSTYLALRYAYNLLLYSY